MDETKVFKHPEYGDIKVVEIDGEPWFIGKDIAEILGYKNPKRAIAKYTYEDNVMERDIDDGMGGLQKTILISRFGLYDLAIHSKSPKAKGFKNWIRTDVAQVFYDFELPLTTKRIGELIHSREFVFELLDVLNQLQMDNKALNELLEIQERWLIKTAKGGNFAAIRKLFKNRDLYNRKGDLQ